MGGWGAQKDTSGGGGGAVGHPLGNVRAGRHLNVMESNTFLSLVKSPCSEWGRGSLWSPSKLQGVLWPGAWTSQGEGERNGGVGEGPAAPFWLCLSLTQQLGAARPCGLLRSQEPDPGFTSLPLWLILA